MAIKERFTLEPGHSIRIDPSCLHLVDSFDGNAWTEEVEADLENAETDFLLINLGTMMIVFECIQGGNESSE